MISDLDHAVARVLIHIPDTMYSVQHEVARLLATVYLPGYVYDAETFRAMHIDRTLEAAEVYGWCDSVHSYLDAVWLMDDKDTDTRRLNDAWHHTDGWTVSVDDQNCVLPDSKHCPCGHGCDENCREAFSVWSLWGHNFIDADRHGDCLRCGAVYAYSVNENHVQFYRAPNGDDPVRCTGDDLVHGIERYCDKADEECVDGECDHVNHECNCALCAG